MINSDESTPERARIARALAALDDGDVDRARAVLREAMRDPETPGASPDAVLAPRRSPPEPDVAFEDGIADEELDDALAVAETNPDEMMSANRVVAETLDVHDATRSDGDFDFSEHPTYATQTMAALLDGQGRTADAEAVRAVLPLDAPEELLDEKPELEPLSLAFAEPVVDGVADAERLRIVTTLESWLYNIRRGVARDPARADGGMR
jgi:hypothetical protein